jgi:hypothetical protein
LRAGAGAVKSAQILGVSHMVAILMIAIFLGAVVALNWVECGRPD